MLACRSALALLPLLGLLMIAAEPLSANDEKEPVFHRIGTGGVNGTYYPIGALIANAISQPPGSRACGDGGSCGVPGLIAVARSSSGSIANALAIQRGEIDSGFMQADIAWDAHRGAGSFKERAPLSKLRFLATLYHEHLQLVIRKDSEITEIADLVGQRVSLDEPGSGTLVIAKRLLNAAGMTEAQLIAEYVKMGPASSLMRRKELDAFFIVAGVPTHGVADLIEPGTATLLDLSSVNMAGFSDEDPRIQVTTIPAGTYGLEKPVKTVGVAAQWIVSEDVSAEIVDGICRALWNDSTRAMLDKGHKAGPQIQLTNAMKGASVPLHKGAESCYRDLGVLN